MFTNCFFQDIEPLHIGKLLTKLGLIIHSQSGGYMAEDNSTIINSFSYHPYCQYLLMLESGDVVDFCDPRLFIQSLNETQQAFQIPLFG